MSDYRYRTVSKAEEHPRDRWLAKIALKVFCRKLGVVPEPGLNFIEPDVFGPHTFETDILGFYSPPSDEINIRCGLGDRDLMLVLAHESRHALQSRTGKYCYGDKDTRERDARIFELEINPPRDDKILRWLAELEVELQHSKPNQTSPQRSHEITNRVAGKMYNTAQERIAYIRNLLQRLPNSPSYNFQRANLVEELTELTK